MEIQQPTVLLTGRDDLVEIHLDDGRVVKVFGSGDYEVYSGDEYFSVGRFPQR